MLRDLTTGIIVMRGATLVKEHLEIHRIRIDHLQRQLSFYRNAAQPGLDIRASMEYQRLIAEAEAMLAREFAEEKVGEEGEASTDQSQYFRSSS